MNTRLRRPIGLVVSFLVLFLFVTTYASLTRVVHAAQAATLQFGGVEYVHRWSKDGQNEFTPRAETDLSSWNDMVTVFIHENVINGDQLAQVANAVLGNYQAHGKILRTDSTPATADRPAEHLVVAILVDPAFLEAAFTRFFLLDGVGVVLVYSHRVYGSAAGQAMSAWLASNGASVEQTLARWDGMPDLTAFHALPQSQ